MTPPALRTTLPLLGVLVLFALDAGDASAQIRASERATVSQTVDGTLIEVDYARPRARGRAPIFGEVVHWQEVWTPGANDATTLTVNEPITLEGHEVPEGSWSVWMVVDPGDTWELVLDPRAELWHTVHPGPTDDQIRFPVRAEEVADGPEVLTWSFPEYSTDETTLVMAWAERRVALEIEVEPSMRLTTEPEEAEPFVGSYTLHWEVLPGLAPPGTPPADFEVEYHADESRLIATTEFPSEEWPSPMVLLMLPRAQGVFVPAMMVDGEIMETFPAQVEFLYGEDGEVTGFEFRNAQNDALMATGEAGD